METWRAKALECFPDLRELIEHSIGPLHLWIGLNDVLVNAYDEPINLERIANVYGYAGWCLEQPGTGNAGTDPSNAVAIAFIENIPLDQRISDDLYRWMSVETFSGFENLFRYHLSDAEYLKFATDFNQRKERFDGPSRL